MRLWTLALCLFALGCGASSTASDPSTESTTPTTSTPPPSTPPTTAPSTPSKNTGSARPASGTQIITAASEYGTMLYDASGQPIYLFDAEDGSRPLCYGVCAQSWPPVLTDGRPAGRGDVQADLLGTTLRDDGAVQVTYAGHPLYFYAHEGKYQVLCHNVEEFGGTWLVVRPDGSAAPG